ncbi:hypothetical protein EB796_022623 [Bugula neritina]|uniref:Uncharacterized protein n=1 Tax=Bugula neritina TaxID=10212 RepID=A0A7J7J0T4_BUGNE|nr:hypothetical protein EB796_022623 [Bugula neritina]
MSYRAKAILVSLFVHSLSVGLSVKLHRKLSLDLVLCALWLSLYGQEVLRLHVLLPRFLSNYYVVLICSLALLVSYYRRSTQNVVMSSPTDHRRVSPDCSYTEWNSSTSDIGASLHSEPSYNAYTNSYPDNSNYDCEPMDCATSELSSLSLGQRSQHQLSPPPYEPLLRASQLDTGSVYSSRGNGGGSVSSFRTARSHTFVPEPRLRNVAYSPSQNAIYSPSQNAAYAPSQQHLSHRGSAFGSVAGGASPPLSVSNYRSLAPDSPSSTIYSNGSYMRVPPEKTSLLTQTLLGISLGVNISIAAFILGRYSTSRDFLSFA